MFFFPLEQFQVETLLSFLVVRSISIGFYNQDTVVFFFLVIVPVLLFLTFGGGKSSIVRLQLFFIRIWEFLKTLQVTYLTYLLEWVMLVTVTLFFVVGGCNLVGTIPGAYCFTAQIIVTLFLSSVVFGAAFSISMRWGKTDFLAHFVPMNVPTALKPFLTFIECVSYISRLFSLAIRLFANLVAGHSLLHILSESSINIGSVLAVVDILLLPILLFAIALILVIYALEFGIALLQAYVFVVLALIYLREAEVFVSH